jgi:hypothetical protein
MRTFSVSPTFADLTDVGVFLALRPNGNTVCTINRVSLSGTLGQNKSIGVALDIYTGVDEAGAQVIGPEVVVRHDTLDLDSNVRILQWKVPPTLPMTAFLGRVRSQRSFWCNNTTASDQVFWSFSGGLLSKPLLLRGEQRWLCLSTSDLAAGSYSGSVVYPCIEWMES